MKGIAQEPPFLPLILNKYLPELTTNAAQLTFTYGGLKCDLDSRVLSTTGVPIPGILHTITSTPSHHIISKRTHRRSIRRRRAKRIILQRGMKPRTNLQPPSNSGFLRTQR